MYIYPDCYTYMFPNVYTTFLYIDTNLYPDSEPPLLSLLTSSALLAKIRTVVVSGSPKGMTRIAVKTYLFTAVSNKQS